MKLHRIPRARLVVVLALVASAFCFVFREGRFAGAAADVERPAKKIFIVVDTEGFSGCVEYWARNIDPLDPRHREYRELMMGDINAAIEGCLAGGATEVVVSDDGFRGIQSIPELLHPQAKLIRGSGSGTGALPLLYGVDESFDGIIMVGLHAMEGSPRSCLAHTWSSVTPRRYWFNGKEGGELAAYAIVAGIDHDLPIIMVAGDQAACDEAQDLLGQEVVAVAVKQGINEHRAVLLAPKKARQLITAGAKQAVEGLSRANPYRPKMPLTIRLEISTKELADSHEQSRRQKLSDWPARRVNDTTFEATVENTKHIVL